MRRPGEVLRQDSKDVGKSVESGERERERESKSSALATLYTLWGSSTDQARARQGRQVRVVVHLGTAFTCKRAPSSPVSGGRRQTQFYGALCFGEGGEFAFTR
jgi:hypothetical protein